MLKYHNGSVEFVGETFECEVVRQWSDETIYLVRSLHDGKIVERQVSEYVADIKVDAPEEIVKEVERIRQAEADARRQKQAEAERQAIEYMASKVGLTAEEYLTLRDSVDGEVFVGLTQYVGKAYAHGLDDYDRKSLTRKLGRAYTETFADIVEFWRGRRWMLGEKIDFNAHGFGDIRSLFIRQANAFLGWE